MIEHKEGKTMNQTPSIAFSERILKLRRDLAEAYERGDEQLLFSLSAQMDEIQLCCWARPSFLPALQAQE